jgi:hypothetical protein
MNKGPGKYDDLATYVRKKVGIPYASGGGGVIVIVIGGDKGDGFAVQADPETTMKVPELLDYIAAEIRKDTA